jgi:hypothetical protein
MSFGENKGAAADRNDFKKPIPMQPNKKRVMKAQ